MVSRERCFAAVVSFVLCACQTEPPPRAAARELPLADDLLEEGVEHGIGEHGWAVPPEEAGPDLQALDGDEVPREVEVDVDADGVPARLDCDDLDARVSPLAPEIRCNEADENCNGVDDCDRDGDGFRDVDDPEPDVAAAGPRPLGDPHRWP